MITAVILVVIGMASTFLGFMFTSKNPTEYHDYKPEFVEDVNLPDVQVKASGIPTG